MPNYDQGFYRIMAVGASAITQIEYQLRQNGTSIATQTYSITDEIAFGTGITFPTKEIDSVSGDFNELRVRVSDGNFPLTTVRVFPLSQFDNPGGNQVEVSPSISFPSGDIGGRRYVQGGLNSNSNLFQHTVHIRANTTRIDDVTYTAGFQVQDFNRVEDATDRVFSNTNLGSNSGVNNGEVRVSYDGSSLDTVAGSATSQGEFTGGPYDYNEGTTLTLESQDIEWHSP